MFLRSCHQASVEKKVNPGSADMKIRGLFSSSSWKRKNDQEKAGVENFPAVLHVSTNISKGLLLRCYPILEQMSPLQDHVGANLLFSLGEQEFLSFFFFFSFFNVCVGYLS